MAAKLIHLFKNQCHDESEVWCEETDHYRPPTTDSTAFPAATTCAECLEVAMKFGAAAGERLSALARGGAA